MSTSHCAWDICVHECSTSSAAVAAGAGRDRFLDPSAAYTAVSNTELQRCKRCGGGASRPTAQQRRSHRSKTLTAMD